MYFINSIFISIYIPIIHCLEEESKEGDEFSPTTPIQPLDNNEELPEGDEMMEFEQLDARDEIVEDHLNVPDQAPVDNSPTAEGKKERIEQWVAKSILSYL